MVQNSAPSLVGMGLKVDVRWGAQASEAVNGQRRNWRGVGGG